MKKLLILPLLFSFLFASCSDDKDETPPPPVSKIDADMRGDWVNTSVERVYYSDKDEVMYQDVSERRAYFNFNGQRMTITLDGDANKDVWTYSFPNKDDSTYIRLQKGSETTDYVVKTLTDTEMVWVDEIPWAGFPEEAPDKDKTTSKVGVYTWKFERKK